MFAERLWHLITGGMLSWYEAKMFIEHASVISSDALHVLVGTVVWLVSAIAWRKPISSWLPWLVLLLLLVFNEGVDLWVEHWPDPAMQYGESAKDVLLTMALPSLLLTLSRVRPQLFAPVRRPRR